MFRKINNVDGKVKVSGELRFIYYICTVTSGHWKILEEANKTIKVLVSVKVGPGVFLDKFSFLAEMERTQIWYYPQLLTFKLKLASKND